MKHVRRLTLIVLQDHVRDLDAAGSPAAFAGLRHVGGGVAGIHRSLRLSLGRADVMLRLRVRFGEKLLLLTLDVGDVGADHALRIALGALLSFVQPDRLVAEALDQAERVRDQQDGLAAPLELAELVEALVREPFVADGEHFVDEQHLRVDVNRHREAQPHVHARRVGLHRRVDELAQLGKVDDLVEALLDLALREAEHDAVDEDVLAPGDLRMKPGAELDQRRDAAANAHRARSSAS